jgi:lipopolysaccharide transport system ATP-binding protein
LFVSHNIGAIQNLCGRSILLKKGSIKKYGTTSSVISEYLMESIPMSKILLKNRKDRQGSGKLRAMKVLFKDKNGNDASVFKSGEDAEIWIEYKLFDKSITKFDFSIGIDSFADQNRIAFLGNKIFNQKISPGKNFIKIRINKLPLAPGRYQFTLFFISLAGEILDWVQKAGVFDVAFGDFYKTGNLPGEGQGDLLLQYKIY